MATKKAAPSFSGEDFLQALTAHDYTFTVGQVVVGKVFQFDSRGIYIDMGGKSPGFLPMEEIVLGMKDSLEEVFPLGSEHEFVIIRDQDADGEVKLSAKRLLAKKSWMTLATYQAENKIFDTKVLSVNKGGVVVQAEGLQGFIPRSQLVERNDLEKLVGRILPVMIVEIEEARNRLILSHRQAAKASAMSQIAVGQIVTGTITGLRPFGAFVDFGGVSGLLHVKEISQKSVGDIGRLFKEGDAVKVVVMDIDESRNRISLSTKILELHAGEMLERSEQVFAEAEERLEKNISQLWNSQQKRE